MRRWKVIGGVAASLGGLLYFLLAPGALQRLNAEDSRRRQDARAGTRAERASSPALAALGEAGVEEPSGLPTAASDEGEEVDAPGTFSLRGVVTDAEGRPLEGVSVGAEPVESSEASESEGRDTTDAQGRFRLRSLAPGHYRVSFERARFIEQAIEDHALGPEAMPLVVALQPAPTLDGRVVDSAGNPLSGVMLTLEAVSSADTGLIEPLRRGEKERRHDVGMEHARLYSEETSTGPDGTFVLATPKPGTWNLRVEGKGFVPIDQDVTVPARDVWIVLGEGASVEATIVDEQDRPAQGASVGLWVEDSKEPFLVEAPVDEAGRAELHGLNPGRYVLVATSSPDVGLRFVTQPLVLSGAEITRVRLRLEEGMSVSGVVEDPSGRPVPDVNLQAILLTVPELDTNLPLLKVLNRFDNERLGAKHTARTGADGRFTLPHLLPLTYFVRFDKKGYVLANALEYLGAGLGDALAVNGGDSGVRAVLAYRGLVSGRVVNPKGEPIRAFELNDMEHESPDGSFEVVAEPPGRRTLNLLVRGVGGLRREYVAKEGEDVNLGELVVGEGRQVKVRVEDASSSKPIAEARVLATDPSEDRKLTYLEMGLSLPPRTKQDGTVLLPDIPRRPLALTLQHKRYEGAQVVLGPREEEVTVRLRPWATLQGWVRVNGRPVAEGDVKMFSLDEDRVVRLEVKEGWYSDQLVPPGSYVVRADCDSCEEPEPIFLPRRIEVPGPLETLSLDLEAARGGATLEVQSFEALRRLSLVQGRPPRPTTEDQFDLATASRYERDDGEEERYSFRHVPPGPHTLLGLSRQEDGTEVVLYEEVEIPAEGTVHLELHPR